MGGYNSIVTTVLTAAVLIAAWVWISLYIAKRTPLKTGLKYLYAFSVVPALVVFAPASFYLAYWASKVMLPLLRAIPLTFLGSASEPLRVSFSLAVALILCSFLPWRLMTWSYKKQLKKREHKALKERAAALKAMVFSD
ncbi:MAG: hypothetical protein H6729_12605 [Deltaproteobacteria bacterium]|nr:hypothetical protein [Deltaproteobacteria bacterium]